MLLSLTSQIILRHIYQIAMSKFFYTKFILLVSVFTFSFNHLVLAQDYEGTDTLYISNPKSKLNQDTLIIPYCGTPVFQGGNLALNEFIKSNLIFPKTEPYLQGTVYVQIVLNQEGCVETAKILKGLRADYDQEALRVCYLMPAWKVDNKCRNKVAFKWVIPIRF